MSREGAVLFKPSVPNCAAIAQIRFIYWLQPLPQSRYFQISPRPGASWEWESPASRVLRSERTQSHSTCQVGGHPLPWTTPGLTAPSLTFPHASAQEIRRH